MTTHPLTHVEVTPIDQPEPTQPYHEGYHITPVIPGHVVPVVPIVPHLPNGHG